MNRINMFSLLHRARNDAILCKGLYALAILLLSASMAAAQNKIGVNLGDNSIAFGTPVVGSAGVVPQANWLNYGGASAANVVLDDDFGNPTTAKMTFISSGLPIIQIQSLVAGNDEALNNSYVASFNPGPMTFTITGVPYSSYDLIAYVATIQTGRTYLASVGSTTLYGISPNPTSAGYIDGNPITPYTYTSAVGTSAGTATPNGNYFRFNGLTGGTLTFSMDSTNDLPTLTGFQIIAAVPEPSSIALVGMGVLGLALAGWKRRRGRRVE